MVTKRLPMTQSPLSQQLKALEEELGITLMKRGNRMIVLIDARAYSYNEQRQFCNCVMQVKKRNKIFVEISKKNWTIGIVRTPFPHSKFHVQVIVEEPMVAVVNMHKKPFVTDSITLIIRSVFL